VWLSDHMMWPKPVSPAHATVDTWTTMTAVGAITSRVHLGFSMLNLSFRPPAVLAKMVTTLDQITKGLGDLLDWLGELPAGVPRL
jgi:alkanesulfonate monooxygenase SsuD/methylene tetrahydromethanopterin reductase-like flavin-dependent oxidoreductase (luciferase family)